MRITKNKKHISSTPFPLGRGGDGFIVFAYITTKSKSEAKKIGKVLLKEKLAACVNIFDKMESMYWWKGKIQNDSEAVLIAKTTKKLFPKLSDKVKSLHSYSCPCILQLEITNGNKEYVKWLLENIAPTLKGENS